MLQRTCLRSWKVMAACAAIILVDAAFAVAQQPRNNFGANQRDRPTTSPFLNMIDNGNGSPDGGTGLSYFNLVRPIQRGRQERQKLQREIDRVQSSVSSAAQLQQQRPNDPNFVNSAPITTGRMQPTGHGAGFNDLGGRFGSGGAPPRGRQNTFGEQPSGGLGMWNNMFRGNSTPNGILGGR